jgi:putative toxin-antitoxin system antitoxin component (TIGR02293 family)
MDTPNSEARPFMPLRKRLEIASGGQLPAYDGTTLPDLMKLGFSMDEIHRFVVPRRTLSRRVAKGEPLTVTENDSALRLVRVMELADRVFDNEVKARNWLRKPSRALKGVAPIDLLESESGAHLVEQALHQIDHGIYI